jgi:hypothetical protein
VFSLAVIIPGRSSGRAMPTPILGLRRPRLVAFPALNKGMSRKIARGALRTETDRPEIPPTACGRLRPYAARLYR